MTRADPQISKAVLRYRRDEIALESDGVLHIEYGEANAVEAHHTLFGSEPQVAVTRLSDSLSGSLRQAIFRAPFGMAVLSDCFLWVESKRRLNESELEPDQHHEDDKLLRRAADLAMPGSWGVWFVIHVTSETESETSRVLEALTRFVNAM